MAVTITRAEIKRKSMIPTADTTYDSGIDALIGEMQPSIEYTLAGEYLNDTGNTGLQATLKLGMVEIISGEFLQQLNREAGAAEDFSAGGITIGARKDYGATLAAQGAERLRPYLRPDEHNGDSAIAGTTSDADRTFTNDSMRGW